MHETALRSHDAEEARPERRAAELLLEQGDLEGALARLQSFLLTEPEDARARGLLGLCLFRLGRLEEAQAIYAALVERTPADPTLRVNLGLVALKRGDAAVAAAQFEMAVAQAPGHKKALNYLGLALAQRGDLALAQDAFERAGARAMAERMAAQLAEREASAAPPLAPAAEPGAEAPAPQQAPEPAAPVASEATPAPAPAAEDGAAAPAAMPAHPSTDFPALTDYAAATALEWPEGSPFGLAPGTAAVHFATQIHTRLDGLVAARGVAAWTPVQKRFRGAAIDRLFGAGSQQIWRATGGGHLLFRAEGRTFTPLRLDAEGYFVEERVFAFDEGAAFENGRLPGQATDLHLVRFAAQGHLLLVSDRPIRAEHVENGCLSLPTAGLVGWSGALAPRLVAAEEGPAVPWIELTGTGLVLLAG
ncbi:tetratricopeptide repeat protein [Vulgatibacter sp.]|uniref:tetratricopeptide repeat protein n=1 Tax=Vulgatibacter sp. TaxID=1971226 RepID=UPI003564AE2A